MGKDYKMHSTHCNLIFKVNSLIVLQNFTIGQKVGKFFRHTEKLCVIGQFSEYETSDNDGKNRNT